MAFDPNEVVTGPIRGYYVAAYACPSDAEREEYAPYFKLFAMPPESYFEQAGCLLKWRPPILTNDPTRAIFLALAHAQEIIEKLPPPEELQESRYQSLVMSLRAASAGV
jgi:hypothetical protein